ncbi:nucleotidyltransferase domain-containing protein [Desulfoscipio sp. XC116]|uniref:nucleotidyltransferase domain-containing protein n=1 Tax=Desulfoscipio sp. XC116 TaxID=3144975 RepID=UPI00325B7B20
MSTNLRCGKRKKYSLYPEEKEELVKRIGILISKRSNAAFAYIYGSFLEDNGFGDIDIAFYFHRKNLPAESDIISLEIQMEMELQKEFGYLFDARIINYAPISFCYNVLKNGTPIYIDDDDLRVNFFSMIVKKYIDFLPYRKRYLKEVLGLEV